MERDMKEFWKRFGCHDGMGDDDICLIRKEIGLFYWERGGKQFVNFSHPGWYINDENGKSIRKEMTIDYYVSRADNLFSKGNRLFDSNDYVNAQDFLDCVDCLGEKEVKKLIKEMK